MTAALLPLSWPAFGSGSAGEELALACDRGRGHRLLIVPALFEEANRLRRCCAEVMRRLDGAGIDSFLPDLPGCNDSMADIGAQTPATWRAAMASAASWFGATHILAIRGGACVAPAALPGWRYAATGGATQLRQLLRARIIADREAGVDETQATLLAHGREAGLELAGYRLSAEFLMQFAELAMPPAPRQTEIGQDMVGGPGLWLRAEPDENPVQADALAAVIAVGMVVGGDFRSGGA